MELSIKKRGEEKEGKRDGMKEGVGLGMAGLLAQDQVSFIPSPGLQ